jgi:uncharacterized protein GlcG (DUF336 family)
MTGMDEGKDEGKAAPAGLTLETAGRLCRAALHEASRLGALVSVAVDGAEIAGPTLATDKAFTAVAHRTTTGALGELAVPGGELAGLHANGGGRYVVFGGGVPLWSDDRVAGGVGVSGGSVAQDVACAEAAAALWGTP